MKNMDISQISTVDKIIAISKAYSNWSDKSFDIDEVNHLLSSDWQMDDFNAFDMPIYDRRQFTLVVKAAEEALTNPKAPWLRLYCECGNTITLNHSEVLWRRKMGVDLPCLCKECVNNILHPQLVSAG